MSRTLGVGLGLALALATAPSSAATLYTNGLPNGAGGNQMSSYLQAEDFALGAASTINEVAFYSYENQDFGDPYNGSISWELRSDAAGTPDAVLAGDTTAAVTRTPLGTVVIGGLPYESYRNEFSIPSLAVAAGTYWLALHNGPMAQTDEMEFYWAWADDNGTVRGQEDPLFLSGETWSTTGHEHAFDVRGEREVVPEPGLLTLMGGGLLAAIRRRRTARTAAVVAVAALWLGLASAASAAGQKRTPASKGRMETRWPVSMGVTAPLRDLSTPLQSVQNQDTPDPVSPRNPYKAVKGPGPWLAAAAPTAELAVATMPALELIGLNFLGLGVGGGYTPLFVPPDTMGEVGTTQYVQMVNVAFAVYDKATGARILGPLNNNTLWSGLPLDDGCRVNNDGDPIVLFDQLANRWVVSQFAIATVPFRECIAVSQTADATGAWNVYSYSYGNDDFIDYPKLGVWPDAYYATFNTFNGAGNAYKYMKTCAFDRAAMLAGAPAIQICFNTTPTEYGFLPSDLDGSTLPPAGTPNYLLGPDTDFTTGNTLRMYKFSPDFASPANSTLTGPIVFNVPGYRHACAAFSRSRCVPQTNGLTLEAVSFRLMHRLAYRIVNGVASLVANMSVEQSSATRIGIRVYELRNLNAATPQVYQAFNLWPQDDVARWMGSAAMDKFGNVLLGYSASGPSVVTNLRVAGRLRSEPRNTLQDEIVFEPGVFPKGGTSGRWGDYSSMTVDPVDDCTFWFTGEFHTVSSALWSTKIASFRFPGCS